MQLRNPGLRPLAKATEGFRSLNAVAFFRRSLAMWPGLGIWNETAPLATGLPSGHRLHTESNLGRASEIITLERRYGAGAAGPPAGYLVDLGVDNQFDIAYSWGVNGRLAQLDALYSDTNGVGPAVSCWREVYGYAMAAKRTGCQEDWLPRGQTSLAYYCKCFV